MSQLRLMILDWMISENTQKEEISMEEILLQVQTAMAEEEIAVMRSSIMMMRTICSDIK